jgi:hypothetical protein
MGVVKCIGFIDGTFIEIRKPWQMKHIVHGLMVKIIIYAMITTIILDHHELFIYIEIGYFGSYHNVNILWWSNVYRNWHQ